MISALKLVGEITLLENGLQIDSISKDQWCQDLHLLAYQRSCNQFFIGDLINYGLDNFGEDYVQVQTAHLERQTQYNYASVCRRVPNARRAACPPLTFSHHEAVACLEPTQQAIYLKWAALNGASVMDLREHIRGRQAVAPKVRGNRSVLFAVLAQCIRIFAREEPANWDDARRSALEEVWTPLAERVGLFLPRNRAPSPPPKKSTSTAGAGR